MDTLLAFEQDPIWGLLLRFLLTLVVLIIIIRFIYYRYTRFRENAFSFIQMGIMIFLVCVLLKTVEIELGVALGLFAIFAILRFRSENLSPRNMVYLFTVIGVSVINSLATFYNPVRGPILINSIIILSLFLLEWIFNERRSGKRNLIEYGKTVITYDRLELLDPQRSEELLTDVSSRTFNKIERVKL
ncbi:MAG: DUF4956 domain-containing protein, partial [Bacteroidia bacterium]